MATPKKRRLLPGIQSTGIKVKPKNRRKRRTKKPVVKTLPGEQPKLTAAHMELAVVDLLNYRVYSICSNISYGLVTHECDLLALDTQGRFTEIEIKISSGDLKADFNKEHGHKCDFISRLIYALPIDLCIKHQDLIPEHCGIISVSYDGRQYVASWFKEAKHRVVKLPTEKQIRKFGHLSSIRIWNLKRKLLNK